MNHEISERTAVVGPDTAARPTAEATVIDDGRNGPPAVPAAALTSAVFGARVHAAGVVP
jgi:hypothetical protein